MWRRSLRFASRGAALLVGIPLAFAAFDLSSESIDIHLDTLRNANLRLVKAAQLSIAPNTKPEPQREIPIFTTPAVKKQFLEPPAAQRSLALDVFKEEYYRLHVPYGEIIYREARKNDLSPELVAAMVHTESDFRASLVSHKSAQGLMQIVPDTARLLGIANPFDPQENIAAGTRYFRYLLDRFDNETIALAAYNAGEGNVERFGGIPPFEETRAYIDRVNNRTSRYRQRVNNTYLATVRMSSGGL